MESSYFLQNASYVYTDACLDMRNPCVTEKRHFGTEATVLNVWHRALPWFVQNSHCRSSLTQWKHFLPQDFTATPTDRSKGPRQRALSMAAAQAVPQVCQYKQERHHLHSGGMDLCDGTHVEWESHGDRRPLPDLLEESHPAENLTNKPQGTSDLIRNSIKQWDEKEASMLLS
ncbi:uncharacterized protein PRD47_011212 isoform 1-T1 [Ara ararauna]